MPRKIEDVIVPERKRTIRDIPIPERSRPGDKMVPPASHKEYSPHIEKRKHKSFRGKRWIVIGIVAVVIAFAALSFFSGATIAYVPKSAPLSFSGDVYTARKAGNLTYSVVKLSKEKSKEVPASGTAPVSRKASGTIIVYNNASAQPQQLVENTRFQTPDGKVYRIQKAIIIPGKTTTPGILEVLVYADEAGESYNIGLSDFTLPGLAGTVRSQTIYARSKTPISGGFIGNESVVKEEDKAAAERELHMSLQDELLSEAKAQVPEGFVMFPSLSAITFENLPQGIGSTANSAKISVRADIALVMFKESELSAELAQSKITIASGDTVDIVPLEPLSIAFAASAQADLASSDEITISVTGEGMAIWRVDETALKADFASRRKQEVASILNNYPTIVSATATVKPFWKSAFPADANKITVKKVQAK